MRKLKRRKGGGCCETNQTRIALFRREGGRDNESKTCRELLVLRRGKEARLERLEWCGTIRNLRLFLLGCRVPWKGMCTRRKDWNVGRARRRVAQGRGGAEIRVGRGRRELGRSDDGVGDRGAEGEDNRLELEVARDEGGVASEEGAVAVWAVDEPGDAVLLRLEVQRLALAVHLLRLRRVSWAIAEKDSTLALRSRSFSETAMAVTAGTAGRRGDEANERATSGGVRGTNENLTSETNDRQGQLSVPGNEGITGTP